MCGRFGRPHIRLIMSRVLLCIRPIRRDEIKYGVLLFRHKERNNLWRMNALSGHK